MAYKAKSEKHSIAETSKLEKTMREQDLKLNGWLENFPSPHSPLYLTLQDLEM